MNLIQVDDGCSRPEASIFWLSNFFKVLKASKSSTSNRWLKYDKTSVNSSGEVREETLSNTSFKNSERSLSSNTWFWITSSNSFWKLLSETLFIKILSFLVTEESEDSVLLNLEIMKGVGFDEEGCCLVCISPLGSVISISVIVNEELLRILMVWSKYDGERDMSIQGLGFFLNVE